MVRQVEGGGRGDSLVEMKQKKMKRKRRKLRKKREGAEWGLYWIGIFLTTCSMRTELWGSIDCPSGLVGFPFVNRKGISGLGGARPSATEH